MNKNRSHFIYQDESGVVGTEGDFVVGLLFVKDRNPIYEIISKVRQKHSFAGELHFSQIFPGSSKRSRVACEILDQVLRENIFFRALVISNEKLELHYFNPDIRKDHSTKSDEKIAKNRGMYRAYNYFTKELLKENSKALNEAVMYLDKKARLREDNICDYIKKEVNLGAGKIAIKTVEPRDSMKDDLIGIADLVLGALNYDLKKGKNPMKVAVVKVVKPYVGRKIRLRNWIFK